MTVVIPDPSCSPGSPHARSLSIPIILPLTSVLRSHTPEPMETARQETPDTASPLSHSSGSTEAISSNHLSPVHFQPDVGNFLDRTIRSSVEQHLFDGNPVGDESSGDCERSLRPRSPRATTPSARQRRRHQRAQQEEGQRQRERNRAASVRADTNKENIPLSGGSSSGSVAEDAGGGVDSQEDQSGHAERTPKARKCRHSPTLVQLTDNQDAHAECAGERPGVNHMETFHNENDISRKDGISSPQQVRSRFHLSDRSYGVFQFCSVLFFLLLPLERKLSLEFFGGTDVKEWEGLNIESQYCFDCD
ncbi:Protein FAM13A [Liparis tanakae]|uniref:Protein FAM13A n=1 Tax=Liparis tanakae TaxID=230148 RepID=A0A4Z2JI36_9TELE|nr:Protein FAM13A [Liparis tanakae]